MQIITLPVHPLSRAALIAHYGPEPITVDNTHDILFDHLAGHAIRRSARSFLHLTAEIEFSVPESLVPYLTAQGREVGARLFNWHKYQICVYASAYQRSRGRGHVKPAIKEWLLLHGVDEDYYSEDAAYKLFQRYGWILEKKNPHFLGHKRAYASPLLSEKKRRRAKLAAPVEPLTWSLADGQVELAVARFIGSYATLVRRIPFRLEKAVRFYYYGEMQHLSVRDLSQKLKVPRSTIGCALQSLRRRCRANPTIARLLRESLALPQEN